MKEVSIGGSRSTAQLEETINFAKIDRPGRKWKLFLENYCKAQENNSMNGFPRLCYCCFKLPNFNKNLQLRTTCFEIF